MPNATYLVGGHDGGATAFSGTYNGNAGEAMARTWQFTETLESGDITFAIPSSVIFPAGIPVVVKSADATFDGLDSGVELTDDGTYYSGTMNIADAEYVTFAVEQAPMYLSAMRNDPVAEDTNVTSVTLRLFFTEDVNDVDTADFTAVTTGTVTGSVQSVTQINAATYDVSIGGVTGNGTLGIAITGGNDITDNFGIGLSATAPLGVNQTYNIDSDAPAPPAITSPSVGDPVSSPMEITGTCTGAENGTVSFTTSPAGGIVPDPTTSAIDAAGGYTVNAVWNPAAHGGTYDLIATCTDTAGNSSSNTVISGLQPDLQGPQAQLEQAAIQADPTNALAAQFTLTFSEPIDVSSLVVGDFDVSASTAPGALVNSVAEISPLDGTTFKVTVTVTADGDVEVSLPANTVEDIAGNANAAALSIDNMVTVDVTPPAAPAINSPTAGQTVNSPTDISITCNEPGEVITITNANIVPNPTTYTCTAAGSQSVPVSWAPGTAGNETLDVTLTDPAGNVSPAASVVVDVDLNDPGVTIEQALGQADPANVFPLAWTITFSEPIDPTTFDVTDLVVTVSPVGSTPVGVLTQVAPNDDTTWEYTVTGGVVTDDVVTVSLPVAAVTDVSGNNNTVSISADNMIAFDDTPPAVPVVTGPVDGDPAGNPTTVEGTCEPGATVTIDNPNIQGSPVTTTCTDPGGTFSVDVLWQAGTSGAQDIDVTQTDAAGNVSPTATVTGLDVDLDPPLNPTITFPDPANAPIGTTDGTIGGTGTPGDTIEVLINPGGQACTAIVQPDGTWECEVAPPFASPGDEGPIFVSATAVDPAGNQSGPATTFAVADVTAPAGPTATSPDGETPDNNPTTVAGSCEPGSTVTISNPLIIPDPTETVCGPDGTYAVDVTWDPAAQGATSTLSIYETDEAGNVSPTTTVDVYVDLSPTMTGPDPLDAVSGEPVTVSGTCEPNGTITLTGPGFTPDPSVVTCGPDGTYTTDIVPTDSGSLPITISQVDAGGSPFPNATDATTVVTMSVTEPANSGGSRTVSSRRTSGGGGSTTKYVEEAVAAVVPATTGTDELAMCTPYLTGTISTSGVGNDPAEVRKLEQFLNDYEDEALTVDGLYGEADIAAVKRFQAKYSSFILEVWGLSEPTGYVYKTTRLKINSFYCQQTVSCPAFTEYNSYTDAENTNSAEVKRTKQLLTNLGFYTGTIDTLYDYNAHLAMIAFQEEFSDTMLKPWNLSRGTGYKYKTTNKFLNELVGCTVGDISLENGQTVSY